MTNKNFFKRLEPTKSKDYYPTPPWATRALFEYIMPRLPRDMYDKHMTCLEPACGEGHMVRAMHEYFHGIDAYDIEDRGYGIVGDFLKMEPEDIKSYDWVITNPPFNHELPMSFVLHARNFARSGIAIFGRIQLTEGKARYENLFLKYPPMVIAPFTERVTLVKNEVTSRRVSTQEYAWFVWSNTEENPSAVQTKIIWIPPGAQKNLQRRTDYEGEQANA